MRRYYLLKGYALVVGVGLCALGLLGFFGPSSLSLFSPPENLLHLGTGLLFAGGALVTDRLNQLRGFVGGMGGLLALGKAVIVATRWTDQGPHMPLIGIVCLVAGVGSLLVATLLGIGMPTED